MDSREVESEELPPQQLLPDIELAWIVDVAQALCIEDPY